MRDHHGNQAGRRIAALAGQCMAFVLLAAPHVLASETGERIAEAECAACHGERGRSEQSDLPSIGGFSEFAIMDLLDSYRLGFRKARVVELDDGSETDMAQIVESLSEEAIDAVALYYADQEWIPHEQPFDADLARRGARIHSVKCGKCHPRGGSVPEADHALLAGQWREYLAGEFRDFDSGARRMADRMKKRYDTLSQADKAALLEFYVSAGRYSSELSDSSSGAWPATSFTTVDYLARKAVGAEEAKAQVAYLLSTLEVGPMNGAILRDAFESTIRDFEDAVVVESARVSNADYIVTRDLRDFGASPIPFHTPESFRKLLDLMH